MNLRPPLYPAVIAVATLATGPGALAAVVKLQIVAWLLVGPLVTLWVYRVGGSPLIVLSNNPGYYLRRWRETWWEFSTTPGPSVPGRWCPINLANRAWALWWMYTGAWVPFAIPALELVNLVVRGSGEVVRLIPIVTYLIVGLGNTAIEPWPGQIRYRMQVEVFLIIALGLVATLIVGWAHSVLRKTKAKQVAAEAFLRLWSLYSRSSAKNLSALRWKTFSRTSSL